MGRKIVSQEPITSAQAKQILESSVDDSVRLNPKIQMLIQTLSLTAHKISPEKAAELVKKLVEEGIPARVAAQFADLLPSNDTEFIALAGSDANLLSKKARILELVSKATE
ncbi:MAG: hypothetical protein QXI37_04530 [Thermoprotei archaeon]